MSNSLRPRGLQPTRLLCPCNFPAKKIGVGCHFFLQGIFLTQGLNMCLLYLLHREADSLPLYHLGCCSDNRYLQNYFKFLGKILILLLMLTFLCSVQSYHTKKLSFGVYHQDKGAIKSLSQRKPNPFFNPLVQWFTQNPTAKQKQKHRSCFLLEDRRFPVK